MSSSSSHIHRQPRPAAEGVQGQLRSTLRYGDRIGPYIVTGFAGSGATSYVYRARRMDSFEPVAIKVLHPHLVADATRRTKFYREARVMMRMQHPNVVRFHEILEAPDSLAFVMEYIDGWTLDQWREEHRGDIDEMTLACVFVDILRGLGNAHRKGVVHRDLKPANVLITYVEERYVAKIIDFGVARFVDQAVGQDERNKIVGTAAYISPEEVIDPTSVCPASDLYSLGVMLYEAACGKRPFDGLAARELMMAHAGLDPESPRQLNPTLSAGLESVILRTLSKAPQERFDSAPQMIRAMELALQETVEVDLECQHPTMPSVVDDCMTTQWTRPVEQPPQSAAGMGLLRRCLEAAFVLFTSTGASSASGDPHFVNRSRDLHLPFS